MGDKRQAHGGDTLRKALLECNELLMNLEHVISDDEIRADIDAIYKVRPLPYTLKRAAPAARRRGADGRCLGVRRIWIG